MSTLDCRSCGAALTPAAGAGYATCPRCGRMNLLRAGGSAQPTKAVRLGGYIADRPAGPSEARAQPILREIPRRVDLRPHCSPVENQGSIGSCAANAVIGAVEYRRKKAGIEPTDLSRMFLYYNTRRLRGDIKTDSGSSMAEAVAAFMAFGAPQETLWPYDEKRFADEPTAPVYEAALGNEAIAYVRAPHDRASLTTSLAVGVPLVFGCFLPSSIYASVGADGVMAPPSEQAWISEEKGGHAMLIVGYDLDKEHYIIRNSWGADWGDGGYCYMPFRVMERGGHPEGFWMVMMLEQERNFNIERPAAPTTAAAAPSGPSADAQRADIRGRLLGGLDETAKGLADRLRGDRDK